MFNNIRLQFSDVSHLGHLLSYNLNDNVDIIRVIKDINRKANSILCTFSFVNPIIKTFLFKSYCLSLYGSVLWTLSSASRNSLQIAINKISRKIWHLPRHSHTSIVLSVAMIPYVHNIIFTRYTNFIQCCINSDVPMVNYIFHDSLYFVYTPLVIWLFLFKTV